MPATHFRCPDQEIIPMQECLTKCRMSNRCMTKNTLYVIAAGQRTWNGTPSTTQLLKGTREAFLHITKDFAIAPEDQAYSLLGTMHHALLAQPETGESINEIQLQGDSDISGMTDLIEPDEDNPGFHIITDYKTYGSYRVAKILGIESYKEPHPTLKYDRSGAWGKKGDPKMIKKFRENPDKVDNLDEVLQLNKYRRLAEANGLRISKLYLQITVRDGGIRQALDRGVVKKVYYPVNIPIIENVPIDSYFSQRRDLLIKALTTNTIPEPCTDRENWEGRKCEEYCDVASFCDVGVTAFKRKAYRDMENN